MDNTFNEVDLSDPGKLAKMLEEHNKWRRGVGKYKWHENPSKNAEMPYLPQQLTMILNSTISMLKRIAKSQRKAGVR